MRLFRKNRGSKSTQVILPDVSISEPKPTLKTVNHEEVESVPHKDKIIPAKVVDVYDGDTCTVIFEYGETFLKTKIRILGIDTPEKKVRGYDRSDPIESKLAELEQEAGQYITDQVKDMMEGKIVDVRFKKWDKFGGRVNGDVFIGDLIEGAENTYTLTDFLLESGYAKPYSGKKKEPWTEAELNKILGY